MKQNRVWIVVLVLALFLSACGSSKPASDPVAVLEALEAAHNAKNPDGVAELYAEDGYEVNGMGTFTGRDEIRELYSQVVNIFSLDCRNYQADGTKVTYECVLTLYSNNSKQGERYDAVVEGGLIKSNTLTGTFNP